MNERTKNIICYVLSTIIVGSITTILVIYPLGFMLFLVALLGLCILTFIVVWIKELLYDFFSSSYFHRACRKYISKNYKPMKMHKHLDFGRNSDIKSENINKDI